VGKITQCSLVVPFNAKHGPLAISERKNESFRFAAELRSRVDVYSKCDFACRRLLVKKG